jgi:hypothetical protein
MTRLALVLVPITLFLVACGGDDPFANADPRCAATCAIIAPDVDGAFDICDRDSAGACVDQCQARIAGVETVCASCLLEDAYFGTGGDDGFVDCDINGNCTIEGRTGTCTYQQGNTASWEQCMRQVYPRREVACQVSFDPVTACATVCAP